MKRYLALTLALILAFFMTAVAVGEEQTNGKLECALGYVSRADEVPLYSGNENENGELQELKPIVDELSKGDDVYVVDVTNDGYAKLRWGEGYVYVAISRLKYNAGAWYWIIDEQANAFDSKNGIAVGAFYKGDLISAVETSNGWAKVLLSDGSYVYVPTAALKKIDLSFEPENLPDATVGDTYREALLEDGIVGEEHFFFSGVPSGIKGDDDGKLHGTPSKAGNYKISVTLKCDDYFVAGYATLAVFEPLTFDAQTLYATVNVPLSKALTVSGGEPGYTFSLPGNSGIPSWLSLDENGILTGTPAQAGVYEFNVQVADLSGKTVGAKITLVVMNPVILNTFNLSIGDNEEILLDLLSGVTGGQPPYLFSILGNLPAGVSISGNVITFKNVPAGSYEITLQATDGLMQTATSTIYLNVSQTQTVGNGSANN